MDIFQLAINICKSFELNAKYASYELQNRKGSETETASNPFLYNSPNTGHCIGYTAYMQH